MVDQDVKTKQLPTDSPKNVSTEEMTDEKSDKELNQAFESCQMKISNFIGKGDQGDLPKTSKVAAP